ncbi:MAG: hypothetical protein A2X23_09910 [Chloroflexi bacterium GWC2_73_18]|nr:MAG: hypothetical protein A2X23_09910 [Chloroflexi bacterium GWC2_73_18]
MKRCPTCQAENAAGAGFCSRCGTALGASGAACPACGAALPAGARFCPACGATTARAVAEERKLVTILFADVTGSTALGERLDPERLRALLQAYFTAMAAVIASWGGTVEKYIGDAIMAAFGVPHVREDDAPRALHAALEMLDRLTDLNRDFETRHRVGLAIRIGVNTGEVIAPVDGPSSQLIVAGDAVNVAARLEQTAEPGTVVVGERTWLAARDAFRFGEPADLELKGKEAPVRARRLLGPLAEASRGLPGLEAPMVGRDRELATLLGLLDEAVESGRPHLAVVYGPAGIGKSRLVREFLAAATQREPAANVLRGRCPAIGHGITYWPLGEILRGACGIALDDEASTAAAKLTAGVGEVLAPLRLADEELRRTTGALAITAGIALAGNPLERAEPREVADELAHAWPGFASALAARDPSVLVVEDLHWAADPLLAMLERLVARSAGPVVFVATARPEFAEAHPAFAAGREDLTAISLRPLTESQSGELLDRLLEIAHLPDHVRDGILARAEGNPYFVEEILRRLIDEGAIVRDGDRWRATAAAAATPLPDTIHALLAARIDALPPAEKRVLQEAAVVGRIFWEAPVVRALGGNGEVVDRLLALESKGLVLARPTSTMTGQAEYAFRHSLVRDVAYAGLPKARRARAHAELAGWIAELAGERRDEFVELLAHHYGTALAGEDADLAWADDPAGREAVRGRAFEALVAAANALRRRFAIDHALELHGRALALAATDPERATAHEALGDDHEAAFHGDDAVAAWHEALAIARRDPAFGAQRARVLMRSARMKSLKGGAFRSGRPDPASIDDEVREGLAHAADDPTRTWLHAAFAAAQQQWSLRGEADPVPFAERLRAAEEGAGIAARSGDPELEAQALSIVADLREASGDPTAALAIYRALADRLASLSTQTDRQEIAVAAGWAFLQIGGEAERVLELGRVALAIGRRRSPHDAMHGTHLVMAATHLLGRWDETLEAADEHLAAFEREADVLCGHVRGGVALGALLLARRGDATRARELAQTLDDGRPTQPFVRADLALADLALGDAETARHRLEEALAGVEPWRVAATAAAYLDVLTSQEDWQALRAFLPSARGASGGEAVLGPAVDRAEGVLAAAAGDRAGAETALRRALAGFERLGAVFEVARTQEALAGVVVAAERRKLLEAALATFEALSALPSVTRVRDALAG